MNRKYTGLEVAVIGISGRFPGANNINVFWENLKKGKECITYFTDQELLDKGVDPSLINNPNYIKASGVLEDKFKFDGLFFGYAPSECKIMHPQTRIFHECCWEALEDAGYVPELFNGKIGLFAGSSTSTLWEANIFLDKNLFKFNQFEFPGLTSKDSLASKIAYNLNLKGPVCSINTACSTSLVSIHLAYRSLLLKECDMALAGGVTIVPTKDTGYLYEEGMILSKDGHCRAFDENASGTIGGSGAGTVLLKLLDEAIKDRDNIYAIIKGSAINNDGNQKIGYNSPSIRGQEDVIRSAYLFANVTPIDTTYVEAHGTGTKIGDPIEFEALKRVFSGVKPKSCAIGSIKTNVGHLDCAAGIAGFIKTVLLLKHKYLVPSLNFENPNSKIDLENSPFYVNTKLQKWESVRGVLRAGVSSFGIGGTNAHVLVEDFPVSIKKDNKKQFYLLPVSAKTEKAVVTSRNNVLDFLEKNRAIRIVDAVYTLSTGRQDFNYRGYCLFESHQKDIESKSTISVVHTSKIRLITEHNKSIVFVFPGQGTEYTFMGKELYEKEPLFRKEIDQCFEIAEMTEGSEHFKLLKSNFLNLTESNGIQFPIENVHQTEISQPLLFIIEYALAKYMINLGIKPNYMIGHSLGEFVAACISGVIKLKNALAIIYYRGKFMQELSDGKMISVFSNEEEVYNVLKNSTYSIAAVNNEKQCIISGPATDLHLITGILENKQWEYTVLNLTRAFHSNMMEPIINKFREKLESCVYHNVEIPYISNITGTWIQEGEINSDYWINHALSTVRFERGINTILEYENLIFIELGPRDSLCTLIKNNKNFNKSIHHLVNILPGKYDSKSELENLIDRFGKLWQYDCKLNWNKYYSEENPNKTSLPLYPFERQEYYVDINLHSSGEKLFKKNRNLSNSLNNWFYAPAWKRTIFKGFENNKESKDTILILVDENLDFSKIVTTHLCQKKLKCIKVFVRKNPDLRDDLLTIDVENYEDYKKLFGTLKERKEIPTKIINLLNLKQVNTCTLDDSDIYSALNNGYFSLINCAKAIGELGIQNKIEINVVTNNSYQICNEQPLIPENAIVMGAIETVPVEFPTLKCRKIDIDLGQKDILSNPEILIKELLNSIDESLVMLRGTYRWIPSYEKLPIHKNSYNNGIEFIKNGVYLITGGTGGIGITITEFLVTNYDATVILTCRSTPQANVKLKIDNLIKNGGKINWFCVDVANEPKMQELVNDIQIKWGKINGIIHAAGIADGAFIQRRNNNFSLEVLKPKVFGTLVLHNIIKNNDIDFLILCSSLTSLSPGVGQVAYASANCFLNSYADYIRNINSIKIVSLIWDGWTQVGMAVNSLEKIIDKREENIYDKINHYLFDGYKQINNKKVVFRSNFSIQKNWFVNEHSIAGNSVLPGVMYLEIARAAFEFITQCDQLRLENVVFHYPMIFDLDNERELRIELEKSDEKKYNFIILSQDKDNVYSWRKHATGMISKNFDVASLDIEKMKSLCISLNKEYKSFIETIKSKYGKRWHSITESFIGENFELHKLKLQSSFINELNEFKLYPALLDMATVYISEYNKDDSMFFPHSYERLEFYKPLLPEVYSYVRKKKTTSTDTSFKLYDITIYDNKGNVLVEIINFKTKQFKIGNEEQTDLLDLPLKNSSIMNGQINNLPKEGISPNEGIEAFVKAIQCEQPQVIITPRDIDSVIEKKTGFNEEYSSALKILPEITDRIDRPLLSSEYMMPNNNTEETLCEIWQDFFGFKKVGTSDDFFELGGDSLKMLALRTQIQKRMNANISISELFKSTTIKQIAYYINFTTETADVIKPVEKRECYPLSSAQNRIYFFYKLDKNNINYNLPDIKLLEGELDFKKIENAFLKIIQRHEVLRTSFNVINYEPVQIVHSISDLDFKINYFEVSEDEIPSMYQDFIKPFDLTKAPLLKVQICKISHLKHVIMFDIHHIICDAYSFVLLEKEIILTLKNKKQFPLNIQYKDYAKRDIILSESDKINKQMEYWKSIYRGSIPVLNFPLDHNRPLNQSFKGESYLFTIDITTTENIKIFSKNNKITTFMYLYSTLFILIHKYSNNEDIIIGCSTIGRTNRNLNNLIGMFINLLPIRAYPVRNKTFYEFLCELKKDVLKAFENQDCQFDRIIKNIDYKRELNRHPLTDILFAYLNFANYEDVSSFENKEDKTTTDISIKEYPVNRPFASKADITLFCVENNTITLNFEYCADLFKKETIIKLANDLFKVITISLDNKDILISDINLLSKEEEKSFNERMNNTDQRFDNIEFNF